MDLKTFVIVVVVTATVAVHTIEMMRLLRANGIVRCNIRLVKVTIKSSNLRLSN